MNCKKKTVWKAAGCSVIVLFMASVVQVQATPSDKISYQGFLTDSAGVPIGTTSSTTVTMEVGFYSVVTGG